MNQLIEKLQGIEQSLKIWRLIILILCGGMIIISFIDSDQNLIINILICLIALTLYGASRLIIAFYYVFCAQSQIFMLIVLVYLIFIGGKFAEKLASPVAMKSINIFGNVYTIVTLLIVIVVLWRHYQKDGCTYVYKK